MNRRLIGILIVFMLVGCGNKVSEEKNASNTSSTEREIQPYTVEYGSTEESGMLKASFGTVKEISESNVVIEGVNSKIYTGDPSGFEELYQGEFVYLEFSSYEETEDGYKVEFTILREEDTSINNKRDIIRN